MQGCCFAGAPIANNSLRIQNAMVHCWQAPQLGTQVEVLMPSRMAQVPPTCSGSETELRATQVEQRKGKESSMPRFADAMPGTAQH